MLFSNTFLASASSISQRNECHLHLMKNLLILYHVEYYICMYVVLQFQPSGSTFLGFKNSVAQFSCNINALLGREVEEIEKTSTQGQS